jgi:hypothetical protein
MNFQGIESMVLKVIIASPRNLLELRSRDRPSHSLAPIYVCQKLGDSPLSRLHVHPLAIKKQKQLRGLSLSCTKFKITKIIKYMVTLPCYAISNYLYTCLFL